jgi:hypothetical protein
MTPGGDAIAVELETLQEGRRYLLNVKSSATLPVGAHRQVVELATESEQAPVIEIPLEAVVAPSVVIHPDVVDFGTLLISKPETDLSRVEQFVFVSRSHGPALEVQHVSSTLPFLVLGRAPGSSDRTYILRLGLDRQKLKKGRHRGTVTVETDDPHVPRLEIPVTLTAR